MSNSAINGLASNPPLAAYGTPVPGAASPVAPPASKVARATTQPSAPVNADAVTQKALPTTENIKAIVADIQRTVAGVSPELQFSVDQKSGQSIVTMTDKTTKEVLWQFPSDEVLQVRKALDQYERGTLVNHKA